MIIPMSTIQRWNLEYSTYIDTLSLFSDEVYSMRSDELLRHDHKNFSIVYSNKSNEPVIFEMRNASRQLGEVDNLTKEDIIQRVIGYIKNEPSRQGS